MNSNRNQPIVTPNPVSPSESVGDLSVVVAKAFTSARSAQTLWSRTPLRDRLKRIRALRALIAEHALELAESSAAARRRPHREALVAEITPLAEACRFLEQHAKSLLAPRQLGRQQRPLWLAGITSEIRREPWGIVLVIGPGNYPLLLPGVQIVQALVAGNGVVLKPGVGGMAAARCLHRMIELAGIDPRLVGLLPEAAEAARMAIAARPDKVVFTGSASVGEKILFQLAPQLTPATMELSGCDAVIVRADADLDLVVKALKFSLGLNDGATCMSPKRVFVAAARATELEGRLAEALRPTTMTLPLSPALKAILDELLSHGAHFIAGGLVGDQTVRLPAVLGGVSPAAKFLREDVFAPIVALVTVADDHETLLRANDCPYALGVSIFTQDEAAARELAGRVTAGVVTINDLLLPTADARLPFGGRNRSGFGSTRGAEGLLELTVPKVVTISRSKYRFAFEPPHPDDTALFQSYLTAAHQRGFLSRLKAMGQLCNNLFRRGKAKSSSNLI